MKKNIIMPPSPKKEKLQILKLFGGISTFEFVISIIFLLTIGILMIFVFNGSLPIIVFAIISSLIIGTNFFLIRTNPKTNLKGWKTILNFMLFSISKKDFFEDEVLEFFPRIKETNDDILKYNDYFVSGFFLQGKNLLTIDEIYRRKIINDFNVLLKEEVNLYFYIYDERINYENTIDYLKKEGNFNRNLENRELNNYKWLKNSNKQLGKTISGIKNIQNNKSKKEKKYVLILSSKNEKSLKDSVKKIGNILKDRSMFLEKEINKIELKQIIDKYLFFENIQTNKQISFDSEFIKFGNEYVSFELLDNYPVVLSDGWLNKVLNEKNIMINFNIKPLDNASLIFQLDKSIQNNNLKLKSGSRVSDSQKKEIQIINQGYQQLLSSLKINGEIAKEFSVLLILKSDDLDELKKQRHELRKKLSKENFNLVNLKYRQFEAFKHSLPFSESEISDEVLRESTSMILASSWPFTYEKHYDKNGMFLDNPFKRNEIIIFDPRNMINSRTNSNIFFLATSGAGKSKTVSSLLDFNIKRGEKIFIIDPENEYSELSDYYGGRTIDLSGSSEFKINPLQVFADEENSSYLKSHITFLSSFFEILFNDLSNFQLSKINEYLRIFYLERKINDEKIKNNYDEIVWPTFNEFHMFLSKLIKNESKLIKLQLLEIESYVSELSIGSYSHIWNGRTSIDLSSPITIFDVHKMIDNEKLVSAQMFLISKIVWGEVENNNKLNKNLPNEHKKWITLAIDEAHLLMNSKNKTSLEWITQATKRIRKRNGSIYIITQNLSDFLGDGEIRHLSSKIINNCTYSFIGALKPQDLSEYLELYKKYGGVSKYETKFLANARKFQFVLSVGTEKKIYLQDTSPTQLNYEPLGWRFDNE